MGQRKCFGKGCLRKCALEFMSHKNCRFDYHTHISSENTEAKQVSPQVRLTELGSRRARIPAQTVCVQFTPLVLLLL